MLDFFNVWDILTGVMSLGGVPGLFVYLYHQLPSRKIGALSDLLKEIDGFFASCLEQGLLNGALASHFNRKLEDVHTRANELRAEVNSTDSRIEDFVNMLTGLTGRINAVLYDARAANRSICQASLEEVRRREAGRLAARTRDDPIPTTNNISPPTPNNATPPSSDSSPMTTPHSFPTVDMPVSVSVQASSLHETEANICTSERTCSTSNPAATQGHRDAEPALESHDGVQHSSPSLATISGSDAPSTRAVPRRKQSTPLSRARAMARALRRNRKRRSLQSQVSCTDNLLELSTIELANEFDEDWEDVEAPLENSTPLMIVS